MQCVILAGGRGTRMASYTDQLPKALIPVHGKPFIDYQLQHLAKTGVTQVLLSIGYKGDQIRDHVKANPPLGVPVSYVDEGPDLRGTGGALRLALDQGLLNPDFLLTYGDAYLPIDFSGVWRYLQSEARPIVMTVYKNANQRGASNVVFEGHSVTLYDKKSATANPAMQYLDYGVLGLRKEWVSQAVPAGASDLSDLFKTASQRGDIAGLEVTTRFFEVGSPEGLKDLEAHLKQ